MPVMDAAGHQVIAGPLGRAAAEHRRFDVDEVVLVEIVAHAANDLMPQHHHLLHRRPAQIEIAVLEPQILAGQFCAAGLERRRQALVEHFQPLGPQLDFAGGQLGIDGPFGPMRPRGR